MRKNTITLGDVDLAYYQNRNSGFPVLFLHGNCLDSSTYDNQFADKDLEKFRLIAFDWPGHGNTSIPANREKVYSLPGFGEVLKNFIHALKIEDCVIVGHSLGGHIAVEASEVLPETRGYVIFGTPPVYKIEEMDLAFLPHPTMSLIYQADLTPHEMELISSGISDKSSENNIPQKLAQTDKMFREYFGKSLIAGLYKNEVQVIEKLDKPIAVFHGKKEKLVNLEYLLGVRFPTLWENKVHIIETAAHSPQFETPEEFNSLLLRFLISLNND